GQTREQTLTLKLDGDKLTGTMPGRNNAETKIEDGKYKDGEVTFKVTREFNGQKFTAKYTAKVSGDTLKGKIETERDGQTQTRELEAKRVRDKYPQAGPPDRAAAPLSLPGPVTKRTRQARCRRSECLPPHILAELQPDERRSLPSAAEVDILLRLPRQP